MKREKIIKYLTVLIMIFVMILNMLRNTSVYDYKFYNISLLELFGVLLLLLPLFLLLLIITIRLTLNIHVIIIIIKLIPKI